MHCRQQTTSDSIYFCLSNVLLIALNIFAYPSFLDCAEKMSFLVQTGIECDAKVYKEDENNDVGKLRT